MAPSFAGPLSFGLASTAFASLCLLALIRRARGTSAHLFVVVLAAQFAWALVMTLSAAEHALGALAVSAAEAGRVLAWTVFLVSLRRPLRPGRLVREPTVVCAAVLGLLSVISVGFDWSLQIPLAIRMLAVTLVLILLEQIYRSADAAQRWSLKFLAIAIACIFSFDLLMYTDGLLFERLNAAWWISRGFANALVAPLLAVAAARNRAWQLDITVSRQVVYRSATLVAIGTYLLTIAASAYYVRYFGGRWGEIAQTVLLFGAAIGLLVVGLSGAVRASIRVFVSKHFFSYQYDYREEWLRLTRLLAGAGGDSSTAMAQRGIEGIGALVESTGGAIWLRDGERFELAGSIGHRYEPQILRADTVALQWLAKTQWVVDIPEWRADPSRYPGLDIEPGLINPHGWLIVPMIINDELTGVAILDEPKATIDVNWEVRDVLKAAAAQVGSFLGVRRAADRIAQVAQFESFNRMSAFVVHDLKNLVAQLGLVLGNAQRHRGDPAFVDDMLGTIDLALARMRSMLRQLRNARDEHAPATAVALETVMDEALKAHSHLRPAPVRVGSMLDAQTIVLASPERLVRILGHLIQNATEACEESPEPRVTLESRRDDHQARIEIVDNGVGMSETFMREDLFRAFASTKPGGMGIGMFECREYVHEIGGALAVDSAPGRGTRCTITLPLTDRTAKGPEDG